MRIMRIFKLVRHFAGLQSLIYTLNQATIYLFIYLSIYLSILIYTLNQAYKELGLLLHIISGCHPHRGSCIMTSASKN